MLVHGAGERAANCVTHLRYCPPSREPHRIDGRLRGATALLLISRGSSCRGHGYLLRLHCSHQRTTRYQPAFAQLLPAQAMILVGGSPYSDLDRARVAIGRAECSARRMRSASARTFQTVHMERRTATDATVRSG